MDLHLLDKIITEVLMLKLPNPIGICGIGEPTLHPEFNEAIEIVSKIPFSLGTNAIALTEEKIDTIIKYKFANIVFSIDATTSDTYFKLKNNKCFDKAIGNIETFIDKIRIHDKFWDSIFFQFIYTEYNKHEVTMFVEYWQKRTQDIDGIIIYVKSLCPSPIRKANVLYEPPLENLSHLNGNNIIVDNIDCVIKFTNCALLKSFALIMSDGAYSPCCMCITDEYNIGNVANASILELYNSNKLQNYIKLQAEHRYSDIPFCKDCIL
jgi:radical SAM protein with 4Fe4S-binding SPASM domain